MQKLKLQFKIPGFYFLVVVFTFSLFIFNFSEAHAASVYFTRSSQDIYPGDVFVVEARISSSDERINVADGAILFNNNKLAIKDISTGGSLFSVWAEGPIASNANGRVKFVGGVPEGFQGEDALILKVIFFAQEEGDSMVAFNEDFSVFLGDGKGTKISSKRTPLAVSVSERLPEAGPRDEWQSFVSEDQMPPEPFEAEINRDPSIFDNQYFVSFFTTDKESGVAYYEVKEGTRDFVRAETPYLLRDQSLEGGIQVKAVDKAGNERIVTAKAPPPPPAIPYATYLIWTLGILLALFIVFALSRFLKAKSK